LGCANCGEALVSRPNTVLRGPDTAWHSQCRACFELIADQLELLLDTPDGAAIRIYRCRRCGTPRSCRPSWTTRCQVCLDERSRNPVIYEAGQRFLGQLAKDAELAEQAWLFLELAPDEPISARGAVEVFSYLTVQEELRRFERPGWSVLACDVHGLPWTGKRKRHTSHGTWARHDACGRVQLLRKGSVDCGTCGPEPGSRTHLARREEPYLLYLVRHRRLQKFGIGGEDRVRAHQRAGAEVIHVLRGRFDQVVLAEKTLKERHRHRIVRRRIRTMPVSFGQGTEVVGRRVIIDLDEALPSGQDVTHWFTN
jgi:hypothetical protein